MLKLYVSEDGKNFTEISALAVGEHLKTIKKVSVKEAIQTYDKNCTSHKCIKNQSNERLYFHIFRKFLEDRGIFAIHEVKKLDIEDFESWLFTRMKASSVNRRMNVFKNFFVKCKGWGFVFENPCAGLKKRKEDTVSHKPWPIDVFTQFLMLTTGIRTDLFYFLWLTGCRPMEAKNLRWTDINHDEKKIIFRCGKNAKVSREFPLTDEVSKILHNMRIDGLYIFSENKVQIDNSLLYHYCKDRLKHIGSSQYTVYGLRHTFGSRISAEGANAFDIADLMGHTKMETTKRYIHKDRDKILKILGA